MPHVEFSRQEIDDLAEKLGPVTAQLDPREQTLLLAIFAIAGHHVTIHFPPDGSDDGKQAAGDFKEQILNAFIPGYDLYEISPKRIGEPPVVGELKSPADSSDSASGPHSDAPSDQT
jgi:hypothetical protein